VPYGHDPERRVFEGRCDQIGDEAVEVGPVCQLRIGAPVFPTLPGQVPAVEVEGGGHQVGACLVEQPMRLRLAGAAEP